MGGQGRAQLGALLRVELGAGLMQCGTELRALLWTLLGARLRADREEAATL